jgi:hypothetical protein
MVLLNTKVTKNTENQKIKKQPPLPCGEGLGVGHYATYVT